MLKLTLRFFTAICVLLVFWAPVGQAQNVDSLIAVLHRSNDTYVQAELNLEIGQALQNNGDSTAIGYIRKAVMLSEREKDPFLEMKSRYLLFLHLKKRKRIEDAIDQIDISIAKAKIMEVKVDEAHYTYHKARALRKHGYSERSLTPYNDALELFVSLKDSVYVSRCFNELGIANKMLGNYPEAISYYKQSLDISTAMNDSSRFANALNNLGNVLKNMGSLDTALTYYHKALEVHEARKDTLMQTNVLNNIGIIFGKIGVNDMALTYYHDCIRLRELTNDTFKIPAVMTNLAESQEVLGRMDSAYHYARLALKLAIRRGVKGAAAAAHESLGDYKYNEGDYDSARYHFEESKLFYKIMDDKIGMVSNIYRLGKVDMGQNRLDEAESKFQKVIEFGNEMGTLFQSSNATLMLAEVYAKQGRYKEAYEYQVIHTALMDSLVTARQVAAVTKQMARFETERKQREIELLNKENEVQALRINREKTLRQSLIFGAILVLILALVLWNRARSLRNVNETLEYQKDVLERNDHEKEVLLKEIHHRVKNNLQIISSLLSMHAREAKDDDVVAALTEGKNRVRSMALIHQMFYQDTEDLTEIGLHTYAKELCESILSSYSIDRNKIDLNLDLDPVTINIDDGILLGLILNELVSNSVKYAFPDERGGSITVNLKQVGNRLNIVVRDDGIGKNDVHGPESTSFGLKLVNSFIRKLKGTMVVKTDNGYCTEISIPHIG